MEPKPRRGRLRRWAGLLAALVCRGVRRAAAALHHRLARRRAASFVKARGRGSGESRGLGDDIAPNNSSAGHGHDRGGHSPSASARRLPGDRAHGDVGDTSAATTLGPGEQNRKHGEQSDAPRAAPGNSSAAGEVLGSPASTQALAEESSGGNTHNDNMKGRRQESVSALGQMTTDEEKNAGNQGGDIDGAKAHGEDATAATPGTDGVELGWCSGGEHTKTGERSVNPGAATHRKHGEPSVASLGNSREQQDVRGSSAAAKAPLFEGEQDGDNTSCHSEMPFAPRAALALEEENPERSGARIAASTTTRQADGGSSDGERTHRQPHEGPATPRVQLDYASARGRRRRPKKKLKPKAAVPLILPIDEYDVDEDVKEDPDPEIQLHESYRDKVANSRKHYTFCLLCHLENRETELPKDQNKILKHDNTAHRCDGILCMKAGCFTRARCKRDLGLHQYVCHNM